MEGGKGTGRECAPLPCPERIFGGPGPGGRGPGGYFLSPEAAGAGAGAGVLGALLAGEDALDDEEALLLDEELPPSFLVELYRSEYQPPPLRTKLERLTTLVIDPSAPHALHVAGAGSEIFCSTSIIFPQLWQEYS
ncbi:hypothetical protein MVI01_32590 [Myxococcus virescens]|uniref:Uncharacterized protein n=1 Tax=Myxococcus virescens TaxID=83456 RepID=A0A511HDC1_9BACT|nr:hypothetical protein MVI01_32590 [Myxococcus virescens]SDE75675.1 hypothetical protein SAMN04488504_11163 [Myxococcus virescens]